MSNLRASIFLAYTMLSSGVILLALLWLALFGRRGAFLWIYIWAKNGILCAKYVLGVRYEIKGVIPDYPAIYAVKHQSAWETGFMQTVLKNPVFVLKKILTYIPLYNILMFVAGYIAVDRANNSGALRKMVKGVKRELGKGSNIIIFPEGTRVPYGERGEIKAGIIALYKMVDAPIIPVSLNSGRLWPRNSFIKKPGLITVTFHEPIEKGLSREEFVARLEEKINFDCAQAPR